jgi:hypothetical protein
VEEPFLAHVEKNLPVAFACGENGRVAEALIRYRDRLHFREKLSDEMGGNMARSHFNEEVRPELAYDFEAVVPADWMSDAGCY